MMSIVVDDDICQLKGITNLTYMTSNNNNNYDMPITKVTNDLKSSSDLMSSLPIRITGYHYITDNPAYSFVLTMIRIALGKQVRLRLRTHLGSAIELKYSLLTFGIDCKNLLDSHDEGKTKLHDEYLNRRRHIESSKAKLRSQEETATQLVEFPTNNDVLIGRGRPYHEFIGTRNLISNIDTQLDRYYEMDNNNNSNNNTNTNTAGTDNNNNNNNDTRFWKTCINIEMVKSVREAHGRFLQRSPQGWKILKDQQSREKTANLFRYRYNIMNNPRNKAVASNGNNTTNKKQQNQQYQQHHQPQMMLSSSLSLSSSGGGGGGGGGAQKRLREESNNDDMTMIISDDIFDDDNNNTNNTTENQFVHCNNNEGSRNINMMISNKRPASASPTLPDTPIPFLFWGNNNGDGSSGMMNYQYNNNNNNNNNHHNHGNSIFQILSSPQPSSSRM